MQKLNSFLFASLIAIGVAASADPASAQLSGVTSSPKTGTRLITLGTRSGSVPTVFRAQSSNILIVNGSLYLVDAGTGVTRQLTRAGVSIRDIDNIFITHGHDDHSVGLASVVGSICFGSDQPG